LLFLIGQIQKQQQEPMQLLKQKLKQLQTKLQQQDKLKMLLNDSKQLKHK
jgi:hypothetical protein